MKIGFKGTSILMQCRGEQYELGKIYDKKPAAYRKSPTLCSGQGYHYCNTLEDVYGHYSNNGSNRFFLIEVLGEYTEQRYKCITTSFRFLREISVDELGRPIDLDIQILIEGYEKKEREDKKLEEEVQARIKARDEAKKVEADKLEKKYARNFNFKLIRELQEKYPTMSIGGSAALFLHGVRLNRWSLTSNHSDIDMCSPYFQYLESWDKNVNIQELSTKKSGNDFDYGFSIEDNRPGLTLEELGGLSLGEYQSMKETGFIKVDIKVDPKQTYSFIEYGGFKYKVNRLEVILEAKARYAIGGDIKHQEDLREISYGSTAIPTKA